MIQEKLLNIQCELKAPKNQTNSYGGYKYRSCEDILEAVKPLLKKYNVTMRITDEVVDVCNRVYVRALVTITDNEKDGDSLTNMAYARESESKKGMDDSQITGTASSYARKYALNGLFLIDDTKDADTDAFKEQTEDAKPKTKKTYPKAEPKKITKDQIAKIKAIATAQGKELDESAISNWSEEQAQKIIDGYKEGK